MNFLEQLEDDVRSCQKRLPFIEDDGGRSKSERGKYRKDVGDCITRSIAIASGRDYMEVWNALTEGNNSNRVTKRSPKSIHQNADYGVLSGRKWFKDYMKSLGFSWTSTMKIGQGCKVHLTWGEVPMDKRLVVVVSRHYTAVVNGTIRDTYDPSRDGTRCVYGYWTFR